MSTNKTIEQRLEELEKRVTEIEKLPSPYAGDHSLQKRKKLSPQEFLATKNVETEIKKVLVFGYYLEHIEGMESFNASDLETIFQSAKVRPPKNINDGVNKNINPGGFIMDAKEKKDGKKAWVLTSTGEKYVVEELQNVSK